MKVTGQPDVPSSREAASFPRRVRSTSTPIDAPFVAVGISVTVGLGNDLGEGDRIQTSLRTLIFGRRSLLGGRAFLVTRSYHQHQLGC